MRTKRTVIGLISATLLFTAVLARAETAVESFAKGETLLTKGEVGAALQSYAAAARADRGNQEYMQHYAMVRRIVDLRSRLETEQNPQRWEYTARALRAFYVSERVYSELLKVDQEIHSRLTSAESAVMLAETQLAMDRNSDAARTLAALQPSKATEMTQALLGIALVRSGKTDQAKQIAEKLNLPNGSGSSIMYAAARLHAASGESAKAMGLLKACFEATLPSQLEGFKSHAKDCPEFAALVSNPAFARVMETQSKMPESKCSGGSSCAGCPMSGKCPSQGKQ